MLYKFYEFSQVNWMRDHARKLKGIVDLIVVAPHDKGGGCHYGTINIELGQ